jgi:VWFA-related protein
LRLPGSTLFSPALAFCFAACLCAQTYAQTYPQTTSPPGPALPPTQSGAESSPHTHPFPAPTFDAPEGLIKLDVVVTDKADKFGKPISGLEPYVFTLLDNGKPARILSFQAFDNLSARPKPPVEVILLIDTVSLPVGLASHEREEVERFLRQNGGHLAQPVSVLSLYDTGLWTLPQPSADGNVLADEIAHHKDVAVIRSGPGSQASSFSRSTSYAGIEQSVLTTLGDIATAERQKPGRKLLIWVGPGWGIGSGAFPYLESSEPKQLLFDRIYWFTTLLREAHLVVYSFSVGEPSPDPHSLLFTGYLNGVQLASQANSMYLYRKVLAVESGGRVLEPDNDLVRQINSCVQEANTFYSLSFDPSPADHPREYHDLKVQIDKPGLVARTSTGYYDQPYFTDQSPSAIKRVTVEQLEQFLTTARGKSDAELARQLSNLELTERLSSASLVSWSAKLRGEKAKQSLLALADASAFLSPPPTEILCDPPPDLPSQQHMISLVRDYLSKTIPRLPNFFASRTTNHYEEVPRYYEGNTTTDYQPLHLADTSKETVLYRNGSEAVDPGAKHKKKKTDRYLITYGTFGPILGAVTDAMATPGSLTWSRWEKGPSGPRAVFRYVIPTQKSPFMVGGCCLPDGDGERPFQKLTGYYGELTIDPATGAILRLELMADLKSTTPLVRSDIMIEYGPVEIGGKTYICPLKSVSISRGRSVTLLAEWDESFRTYGPYATMLNDITFGSYHVFRAESRLLTDTNPEPDGNPPAPGPANPPPAPQPAPQ